MLAQVFLETKSKVIVFDRGLLLCINPKLTSPEGN